MKVTRVQHVSVNVESNLRECQEFYESLFGLQTVDRPEIPGVGGTWYSLGEAQLHLVDAAHTGRGIDPTGPHWCVMVDDLDAAIKDLQARGVEYLHAAQGPVVQIFVCDPAGNTIELQQDR